MYLPIGVADIVGPRCLLHNLPPQRNAILCEDHADRPEAGGVDDTDIVKGGMYGVE